MSYTGDQLPKDRKLDKNGILIDPEEVTIDRILKMFRGKNPEIVCTTCKHLNEDGVSCKAFPNVIPQKILSGQFQHDRPFKDDNGIMWEAIEDG